MATYNFTILCTLCIFAALLVPSTSAWFWSNKESTKTKSKAHNSGVEAEIVNKHNELRRSVRPSASNMLKMSWSKDSAAKAQEWANTCSLRHSTPAFRKIGSTKCGENLYMGSSKVSWNYAIQNWYDEVNHYRFGRGSTNGKDVGHYTQVVWYRSNMVGCAMAHCPHAEHEYFYVCQYCPAGNVRNALPYKRGRPCGDCPHNCDNKLCTNPCPHTDTINNCAQLKAQWTCGQSQVAAWCPATCKCTSEIN